jgi:hypothetical protein
MDKDDGNDSRDHRKQNDIPPSSYPIVTKVLSGLALVEAGEYNVLIFQESEIMKEIRDLIIYITPVFIFLDLHSSTDPA